MARKRCSEEIILRLVREIEAHLHGGMDVVSACRTVLIPTRFVSRCTFFCQPCKAYPNASCKKIEEHSQPQ